jgi:hypothetical protein
MDTIKIAHLEGLVKIINRITGSPETPWSKDGERMKANIGNYHLDGAYGGYSLNRMVSEGGGVSDVFRCGHVSKRELYNRMRAFIDGLETRNNPKGE